jgi:hypothetical protein
VGDSGGVVSRWVGKVSKEKKESRWGAGRKSLQKKTEMRAEKVQTKKVNLGWHRDRKENPITAPSIHVGAHLWVLLRSGPMLVYSRYSKLGTSSSHCLLGSTFRVSGAPLFCFAVHERGLRLLLMFVIDIRGFSCRRDWKSNVQEFLKRVADPTSQVRSHEVTKRRTCLSCAASF